MVLGVFLNFYLFLPLVQHRDKFLFQFLVLDGDRTASCSRLLHLLAPVDRVEEVNVVDAASLLEVEPLVDGCDVAHLQLRVDHVRVQKDKHLLLVNAVFVFSVDKFQGFEYALTAGLVDARRP